MNRTLIVAGVVVLVLGLVAVTTLFTVHQRQQAIVLRFGEVVRVIEEPGLNWKIPFAEEAVFFERRVLDLDPPDFQVLLTDKKRININAYARYRIVNALRFFQVVQTEEGFRDRFGRVVNSSLRAEVAKVSLAELLSEKRDSIMRNIRGDVDREAENFGIEIIDVRIGRTDLPDETSQAVYSRMRSERERLAKELRAQGEEESLKIRARADREKVVLVAEAERQSRILVGEGDAQRNRLLGEAYGKDPDFFAFFKSMQQYQEALSHGDTTLVLSPDSDFFRYFNNELGATTREATAANPQQ